jgi:regulatory protein
MNHKVTAIQIQKRNRQRVSIFLDGDYAFGLSRIVAAWLEVGQDISDEKIARLRTEDEREVVYLKTLNFIQYRPRSNQELRRYLVKQQASDEIVEQTLERLQRAGLVDDARFAQSWVENRTDLRPRSRQALAYELRQRGIDSEIISEALEEVDDGPLAIEAARKQSRRYQDLEWQDFRQKMCAYLARRGFNYSVSVEAAQRVWSELQDGRTPDHNDID